MGLLIDFYTGDTNQIVTAWKSNNAEKLAGEIVSAHADLSFHLSAEDLDLLVLSACRLLRRTPMTFEQSIETDFMVIPAADPEKGIHAMTHAFTDLFATIPVDQATALYEMWVAQMPKSDELPPRSVLQIYVERAQRVMLDALFTAVLAPILAAYWLFSPSFRRERRQNKLKRREAKEKGTTTPEYTLKEATVTLITTCQTAKAQGSRVIYAWSL
jgi:hypothetical protein